MSNATEYAPPKGGDHGNGRGPAERFVSGVALPKLCNKPVCRCAVCSRCFAPSVPRQSKKTVTKENLSLPMLDYVGSPCKGLDLRLVGNVGA